MSNFFVYFTKFLKPTQMKRILVLAIAGLLLTFVSCKKKELIPGTYESHLVNMGNGKVFSWMTFDKEGKPVSLGLSLDDAALTGLPQTAGGHNHYDLPLPPEIVSITPFNHIVIDWNPAGHDPVFYASPHFDFHFYSMTSSDRKKIPAYGGNDTIKFQNAPHADYFPVDYVPAPGGEPEMGAHWVYKFAPELPPTLAPFTETFVYGSYDGKVNFIEPMVTHSFFQAITDWSRSIPQPAKVQISGYYPTKLHITHVDGIYKLALEELVYRVAS
jgi:hypothetical protein